MPGGVGGGGGGGDSKCPGHLEPPLPPLALRVPLRVSIPYQQLTNQIARITLVLQ